MTARLTQAAQDLMDACQGQLATIQYLTAQVIRLNSEFRLTQGPQWEAILNANNAINIARAALHKEPQVDTEDAIRKLAGDLPEDYEVTLHIERGAGWVTLECLNNDTSLHIERDDSTMGQILLAALERAQELEKEAKR